jgi:hypothetical protein
MDPKKLEEDLKALRALAQPAERELTEAEERGRKQLYTILGYSLMAFAAACLLGVFAIVALLWKWVLA